MKIIKNGKIKKQTKEFTCKECGCVFEADKGEYRYASQIEAVCRIEAICDCPNCKSTVHKHYGE